jgi:hypothetical protein
MSSTNNQTCLSRATTIINEKIRHHKLSAKEIHFSRDSATNEPIQADDKKISDIIQKKREADNSSRSNSSSKKKAVSANAAEGQLVFIKAEGDKRSRRDLYLVLERHTEEDTITICKVRDALSNKLASMAPHDVWFRYIVKQTEVMLAPNQPEVQKHIAVELDEIGRTRSRNLIVGMIVKVIKMMKWRNFGSRQSMAEKLWTNQTMMNQTMTLTKSRKTVKAR